MAVDRALVISSQSGASQSIISSGAAVAAEVGKAVSSVDGLYDLQGTASAILAAA